MINLYWQKMKNWPWWLLALALAALPAAAPYLSADLPRTNDALPHLYRSLALDRLVRQGVLWPRWSPDLVHGFGYPVFNFFPILSHASVVFFHRLGLTLTSAYRAVVLCQFVLSACFTYLLARDWFDSNSAWAAALAYIYSPYLLYDAHVRAGLPESSALVFLPLTLFCLRRAAQRGGAWIVLLALTFAAAILSHFPIAYQFGFPMGLLLLWIAWRGGWRKLLAPTLGLALSALLTAFFWLPALLEVQYVRANVSISQGYNYSDNFVALGDLLSWPRLPADPALLNPPVVRALPLAALAWALGLIVWRWRKLDVESRQKIGVWLAIAALCVFLVTPAAKTVWAYFPLLKLTLYPWRFLGIASLAGAMLAAASLSKIERHAGICLALFTALMVVSAIPWLYPPREPVPESPTIADLTAFEQPPLLIGTTTLGEFLPRWVRSLPDSKASRQQLAAGEPLERLAVVEGVHAQQLDTYPLGGARYHITVTTKALATLNYNQFYFPGWRATLDGQALDLRPSPRHGLVQFNVPPGEHTLTLNFGDTLPRRWGWALSGLALLIALLILFRARSGQSPATTPPAARSPSHLLLLLALLSLSLKVFFDHVPTPLHRSAREDVADLSLDMGELRLLGYSQSRQTMPADEPVQLTLYWQPLHDIGLVYDVAVKVVRLDDANGLVWSRADAGRPNNWRFAPGSDQWPLDSYVMDPFVLKLLDGALPGDYAFQIALVRRDTGQTVAETTLGKLGVSRPGRSQGTIGDGMTPPPTPFATQGLSLLGSWIDRREAAPGDPVRISLLWQVTQAPAAASPDQMTLQFVATQSEGQVLLETQASIAGGYAPDRWQPDDRLRSEILLRLPASTPDGEHVWQIQVGDAIMPICALHVNAPQRRFEIPPVSHRLQAEYGGQIRLLGIDWAKVDDSMPVTLVWQGIQEMPTSYHVFLHLLGPEGELVTQSDGAPASWTRPTSGWLPDEVILDERQLNLPSGLTAGDYTLRVGLYDPASNDRLTLTDGNTFVNFNVKLVD